MKMLNIRRWIVPALCAAALAATTVCAETTDLYYTGFESAEGYAADADLVGQGGWTGFGTGSVNWNGVLSDVFETFGQQAYIGYTAPADGATSVSMWKDLPAPPTNHTIIYFSTALAILDSSNGHYDDFRWSVFNRDVERLFTLDFDNHALQINYALDDDQGFISTGQTFEPNRIYYLWISMDTSANLWSAYLDEVPLVINQPMTTASASLTVGDIDAVWSIRDASNPGDNYMVFDDYWVQSRSIEAPQLQNLGIQPDGSNVIRVTGESDGYYVLDVSADLQAWTPVSTNTPASGTYEFRDEAAVGQPRRFYRIRAY